MFTDTERDGEGGATMSISNILDSSILDDADTSLDLVDMSPMSGELNVFFFDKTTYMSLLKKGKLLPLHISRLSLSTQTHVYLLLHSDFKGNLEKADWSLLLNLMSNVRFPNQT